MKSLHKNKTWELVKRPEEWKIVTCKWIFKKKEFHLLRALNIKVVLLQEGSLKEKRLIITKYSRQWSNILFLGCY